MGSITTIYYNKNSHSHMIESHDWLKQNINNLRTHMDPLSPTLMLIMEGILTMESLLEGIWSSWVLVQLAGVACKLQTMVVLSTTISGPLCAQTPPEGIVLSKDISISQVGCPSQTLRNEGA
jgi:hypothetical protein